MWDRRLPGPTTSISNPNSRLKRLEYRGYDSAGIALVHDNGELEVFKSKGKVANLEHVAQGKDLSEPSALRIPDGPHTENPTMSMHTLTIPNLKRSH